MFFLVLGAGPSAPTDHLREIFYILGLDDKEVVALFGHIHLEGLSLNGVARGKPETKYTAWTRSGSIALWKRSRGTQ